MPPLLAPMMTGKLLCQLLPLLSLSLFVQRLHFNFNGEEE